MDFFNEVNLIFDIITEIGIEETAAGQGFPPGFEYRWADAKTRTTISCSGPQYVQHVLNWVEGEISNEQLFPTSPGKYMSISSVRHVSPHRAHCPAFEQPFHSPRISWPR